MGRTALSTALAAAIVAGCAGSECESVLVEDGSGARVLEICVEVAATEMERATGLRGHRPLAEWEGLLLDFPVEDDICLVNEGVGFAIDALYADADGGVVAIERAIPAGDGTPRCHGSTQRVLEVAAGVLEMVDEGGRLSTAPRRLSASASPTG